MKIKAGIGGLQHSAIENSAIKQLESVLQDSELLFFVLESAGEDSFVLAYLSQNFKSNITPHIGFFPSEKLPAYRDSFFENPDLLENLENAFDEGRRASFEMCWAENDTVSYWRVVLSPTFDEHGICIGFSGNALNINDQVDIKRALKESKERYKLLTSLTFEGIVIHDNGIPLDMNGSAVKLIGYSKEELLELNLVTQLIAPEYKELVQEKMKNDYSKPFEVEVFRKGGDRVWIEIESRFTYQHGKKVRVAAMRDITERKEAEKALAESEARWQFALEGSELGVYDIELTSQNVYFSKKYKEMLGYTDDEIQNLISEWERLTHPDDVVPTRDAVNSYLLDNKKAVYEQEYRMKCKNGLYKWILARGKVTEWTDDGKPLRMIGTHMDIDYLKRTELALKESMRKFHNTLRSMASGVI